MQNTNKLTLINLEKSFDPTPYSYIFGTEMTWLFKGRALPANVLFIPDAYNGPDLIKYINLVKQVFLSLGINIILISETDPIPQLRDAKCIVVGGGSMEKLLRGIDKYKNELIAALLRKVPFLGWNEGAVLVCPGYVVPDPIPGFPNGLAVTNYQYFMNFDNSVVAKAKMLDFLKKHETTTPSVTAIYALVNTSGGTGVRLEDDIVAIDYGGNSPVNPTKKFTQGDLK
jgi:peptidase E